MSGRPVRSHGSRDDLDSWDKHRLLAGEERRRKKKQQPRDGRLLREQINELIRGDRERQNWVTNTRNAPRIRPEQLPGLKIWQGGGKSAVSSVPMKDNAGGRVNKYDRYELELFARGRLNARAHTNRHPLQHMGGCII